MNGEHLQISEIALFRNRTLSREEVREASRHLLICSDCRDLLPNPSRKEFLESVFIEQDDRTDQLASAYGHRYGFFSFLDGFRQVLSPVAGVAILIVVTAGLSFLIFLRPSGSTEENLVVSIPKDHLNRSDLNLPVPGNDIYQPSNSDPISDPMPSPALKNRKQALNVERPKRNPLQMTRRNGPVEVETRGVKGPCESNKPIMLETSVSDEGIRMTWDKVADAAKYDVYISDPDERLVDQFESDRETSYVSKANFEQDIVYKWRLIITLKSGETIVADSQQFRTHESNGNNHIEKKVRLHGRSLMNTRCVEKK